MSDYASNATQHTLMQLEQDDWVGRSVLAREAAYLFPQAVQMNGCRDCEISFTRNADLLRHIASVHNVAKKYTCPAVGCLKHSNIPTMFSRADKLTDHILAVHKQSYWRFTSHDVACEIEMHMTLAELVGHLETCREGRELHGKSAMRNAAKKLGLEVE